MCQQKLPPRDATGSGRALCLSGLKDYLGTGQLGRVWRRSWKKSPESHKPDPADESEALKTG